MTVYDDIRKSTDHHNSILVFQSVLLPWELPMLLLLLLTLVLLQLLLLWEKLLLSWVLLLGLPGILGWRGRGVLLYCRERGSGAGGAHGGAGLGATHLGCFLELGPTILEPNFHLCLCELEQEGDLGALGEGQVLRPLEPGLQLLDLRGRVNGSRVPNLLPIVHPDRGVLEGLLPS